MGKGLSQACGEAERAAGDLPEAAQFIFQREEAAQAENGGGLLLPFSPAEMVATPDHIPASLTLLPFCSSSREGLTASRAVVTDDRQEVVGGDLGHALLGQEGSQIQPFQGEGDVAVDLEGIHHLVPEPFQVDAKDLKDQEQRTPKGSFAMGALGAQHISACPIFAGVLCLFLMNPAGSLA